MTRARDTFEDQANRELAERIRGLRESFENALGSVIAPLRIGAVGDEARGGSIDLHAVLRFLETARAAGSQKEILRALLDVAATCETRVVLFILRSGALVAWDSRNMEAAPGTSVRRGLHLTIPAAGDHLAARAMTSRALVTVAGEGPGFLLTEALGGFVPARSAAAPLVVRGRPVALLYGDCGKGDPRGSELLLAILAHAGSLAIEALGAGRRSRGAAQADVDADCPASPGGPEAEIAARPRAGAHGGESAIEGDLSGPFASTSTGAPAVTTPQAPEEAEMQALLGDIEGMRREPADDQLSPDERRADADARRFASLLVSEILLYNEEAVILGRRNRDLSRRLAREIEKSRQAFTARAPVRTGAASRYFEDEVLRVLAEGDPSLLGG